MLSYAIVPRQLKYTILLHISIHQRQQMSILLLIRKILADILHGDKCVHLDAELLADLHNSGLARVLADLTAVYRNEHIGNLHICAGLQHRHGLADSGACGDYVLDDDNAVAVLRLVADDIAAFAMVLASLRLKKNGLSMPQLRASAPETEVASGMPLYAGPNIASN